MKRILALLVCLLLCGCARDIPETTAPTEPTDTTEGTAPSETTEATAPTE